MKFIKTNSKIIKMQRPEQSITKKVFSLGIFLLAVLCVLLLVIRSDPNKHITLQGLDGQRFGLLFLLLPVGSLWKKIISVFHLKETQSRQDISGSMAGYAKALAAADGKEKLKEVLLTAIQKVLDPQFIDLYLYDSEGLGYTSDNDPKQNKTLPNFIVVDSSLPKKMSTAPGIFFSVGENDEFQAFEETKLGETKSNRNLLVPINNHKMLIGWLVIGPSEKDQAYADLDIEQVKLLTDFFSTAYENADLVHTYQTELAQNEIRNRIMNTVNTDEDLDQVLTNIFSQLQEIFAIHDLSLILRDPETFVYKRLFTIKNNHLAITTNEPEALNAEYLEKDTIATGHMKQVEENGSWLIIPLVSNEEIIGALSMGNEHEKGVFKTLDTNFIHFLAGAVANATQIHHLKQANHRQNQQIYIINKVSEQLTSIMNLESLLVNILDAAMNILNCSSGVLMVIDEDQDELVLEVAAGPVGSKLLGERLPSNAGIAGQAFTTQKPIISNQVDQSSLWFRDDYPKAVAKIANIMAVPLIAHGHVIGILELINKQGNLPFNQNDQKILESFANQAAVALHNASLYSETDQALEARVEELYIMQQIDRDLNATQDINRALQRMLSAALKHTSARYGTIGLVDQNAETYEHIWQFRPGEEAPLMLDDIDLYRNPWFSDESFKPEMFQSPSLSSSFDISELSHWHYLIFSELEDDQALLLVLHAESREQLTRQDRAFLTRLKDHSIIALNNALLYEELHDAIQSKNDFIGFISHELKNPLTVIKGYADILRKGMAGDVNEEQIDYLTTINHNVKRMDKFIKDLSDQAHIETKSLRIDFESTPVREVVNEVLQSYEAQIENKSLQIVLKIPGNIPNVWCDRMRLIQVLANLISNAIKYTPPDRHINIGAEQSANIWDEKGAAEVVHFWVQDNGYGISQEDQEHLFEKFYRGTNVRLKKIPGTGLGLRIAKSLVEMMGGRMWFTSTLDEGSTFDFTLPI